MGQPARSQSRARRSQALTVLGHSLPIFGAIRGNSDHRVRGLARRYDVSPVPDGGGVTGAQMSLMNWIGLALCLGITIYLVIALLLPEKFQ
jgi:K+-transporting ATPase KdpF subunit